MLCVLLGSGLMVSSWWLLLISFLVFMAGTEILVRIEDQFASHFGERFKEYKRRVPS